RPPKCLLDAGKIGPLQKQPRINQISPVGDTNKASELAARWDLVEIRQLSPDMRKTSAYGAQQEADIVLLPAKPLLRGCEQDFTKPRDGRSRIMGSLVKSKVSIFYIQLLENPDRRTQRVPL